MTASCSWCGRRGPAGEACWVCGERPRGGCTLLCTLLGRRAHSSPALNCALLDELIDQISCGEEAQSRSPARWFGLTKLVSRGYASWEGCGCRRGGRAWWAFALEALDGHAEGAGRRGGSSC